MALWLLRQVQGAIRPLLGKGEVMQDLEFAMRTKTSLDWRMPGSRLTIVADVWATSCSGPPVSHCAVDCTTAEDLNPIGAAGMYSFIGWFTTGTGHKLPGAPTVVTLPGWIRFGTVAASSYLTGKVIYYAALHMCAEFILKNDNGEDRMKMELANIILTKHNDDKLLVESVKRQFIAEHLFNDLHQDKPLFRWRPRHSYVDRAFMERLKEMEDEVNKSEDEERSISGETNVNMRSFGDIMHDPLACVLGSPGSSIESNSNLTEKACTTLKKSGPRALRRSIHHRRHRHRHRHRNKLAAL